MNWNEYPWALEDRTIERPVTGEDGGEDALLFSVSYHKRPDSFFLISREYQLAWSRLRPERLTVRRKRTDPLPLIDLGTLARIETEEGADEPDGQRWELVYPRPDMYRNGPYFFHEMERVTISLRTASRRGGAFQFAVTCTRESLEAECVYFPPEAWRGKKMSRAWLLLSREGGSRVDADAQFSPLCEAGGPHMRPIDEPGAPEGRSSFLTPPFCYPFRRTGGGEWFSLSVEPEAGEMTFSRVSTWPDGEGRVALRLDYASPVEVGECLRLPRAAVRLGARDPFDALERQARALVECGRVRAPVRKAAAWWTEPIACGWREQTNRMQKSGRHAYSHCTQEAYEALTERLDALSIPYGTLVIDAIWSLSEEDWTIDQEKWPDMRGFIDRQHAKGRHVLLWVCPNCGSLPDGEAYITREEVEELVDPDAAQHRTARRALQGRMVDPLSPAYRERVYRCLHTMLSGEAGCLNADGLKLDYTGGMPQGEIVRCTRPLYGYEYLLAQYSLYHDAAKAAKPDCLLEFQVANPYMAGCFDMARLNDYLIAPGLGMAREVMADRMRIARAENLGALIDVDGIRSLDYIRHMDELGVPAIYLGIDDFARCPEYAEAAKETFERWRKRYGR